MPDQLEFPGFPEAPRKHEYDNAQFDPEAPHSLSGVMKRWVVPEGGKEEPVRTMVVPRLEVRTEEEEEDMRIETYLERLREASIAQYNKRMLRLYVGIVGGFLFISILLNVILLIR
jgi:hypothetical protein